MPTAVRIRALMGVPAVPGDEFLRIGDAVAAVVSLRSRRNVAFRQSAFQNDLPGNPFDARHMIEMTIPAEDWQNMLASQTRDPQIVGGNWRAGDF